MPKLNLCRGCVLTEEGDGVKVVTEKHGGWSTGWLARVDEEGALTFLNPDSAMLSRAGNGNLTYWVGDGTYEGDSVYRSFQSHRSCFRVANGRVEILADDYGEKLRAEAKARRDAARAEALAAAGIPPLIGSPKQIAWANKILAAKVEEWRDEKLRTVPAEIPLEDARRALTQERIIAALVRAEPRAKFWIDERYWSLFTLAARAPGTVSRAFAELQDSLPGWLGESSSGGTHA